MTSSIYNSRSAAHKSPFGAVRAGTSVTFTLHVPHGFGCEAPYLLFGRDGEAPSLFPLVLQATQDDCDWFALTMTPAEAGLYFYYFDLYTGYRKLFCGAQGEAYITTAQGSPWQLTVYEANFTTPAPLRGGVLYQIFPDRFCEGVPGKPMPFEDRVYRENKHGEPYFWPNEQGGYLNRDYYGGDLAGIVQKLPYLAEMGVTALYLNPIFEAHANHRYNTADYLNVDPLLGTNDDFISLCKAAKAHGIGVILDGVFSHTGSDSVYFNREGRYGAGGAYHDKHSPYRSWFDFSPNYPCGYRSWWGFETLPEVNENDARYRAFICGEGGAIDTWMQRGAAGFRLDVADELPDDFIAEIRTAVKRYGDDKYLLGEVWEDATTKQSYGTRRTYLLGKGLDAVMNYPFRSAALNFCCGGTAQDAVESITRICENYPQPALHTLMNFLSTHDTVRAITALAGENGEGQDRHWQSGRKLTPAAYDHGVALLCLAYAMIFTLPGIPSVYYGDEIAMQGYKDPFNRGFFDWESTEHRIRPVLCALAAQRRACPAFAEGTLTFTRADGGVLCYERHGSGTAAGSAAGVCINRTDAPVSVSLLEETLTVPALAHLVVTQGASASRSEGIAHSEGTQPDQTAASSTDAANPNHKTSFLNQLLHRK